MLQLGGKKFPTLHKSTENIFYPYKIVCTRSCVVFAGEKPRVGVPGVLPSSVISLSFLSWGILSSFVPPRWIHTVHRRITSFTAAPRTPPSFTLPRPFGVCGQDSHWLGRQGVYAACCSVGIPNPSRGRERGRFIA